MPVKDVGHLEGWPRQGRRGSDERGRRLQQGQGASHVAQGFERHARVERGGVQLLVPEQDLDHPDVGLALQEVGGEAMPQGVERHPLVQRRGRRRRVAGAVQLASGDRLGGVAP